MEIRISGFGTVSNVVIMAQVLMKKEQMGNYSTAKPKSCTHTMNMFPYWPDTFNKTGFG